MIKGYIPAAVVILALFLSCSDETTIYQDDLQDNVLVENGESKLRGSISYVNSGVLGILEEKTVTQKGAVAKEEEMAGDYPLTLVAQILPPTYPGRGELTSTHVHIDGQYAYVSYNTTGDEYFGAIQVIDVGNPIVPKVTSQLIYLNADINSIEYDNGYVYVVGGVNSELSVTATSNSFIAKIASNGGKLNTGTGITYGFQPGFNANDVFVDGSIVYVTSGKDGTLTAYNKGTLAITNEVPFSDLRSLAVDNGKIALLDASSGIRILTASFQPEKEIPISTNFGPASKKTIDFMGDRIVVAEAGKGAGIYSYSSGNLLEYLPILINPEGVSPEDINTNAVAFNSDVILMANGGAGLALAEKKAGNTPLYGIIELDGSTNFVEIMDDFVFAASGREGLQIIKLNKPDETLSNRCLFLPLYLGSSKIVVSQGEVKEYTGAKRFNTVNVSGSLLLCGSWTVSNAVTIHENALFEMRGTFAVGRNNKRKDLTVDNGATFRVEGTLQIYGDLILQDNATLEFIGPSSIVSVSGSVKMSSTATVKGDFLDLNHKF